MGIDDADPIALLRNLVRIETENPPGNGRPCTEYVVEWFDERGIEDPYEDRPQAVATVGEGELTQNFCNSRWHSLTVGHDPSPDPGCGVRRGHTVTPPRLPSHTTATPPHHRTPHHCAPHIVAAPVPRRPR